MKRVLAEDLQEHVGARLTQEGVEYAVWAKDHAVLSIQIEREGETRELPMERDGAGYHRYFDPHGRAGDLYRFRLPDGRLLPDVASRFQPQGVHGPSECIDPSAYVWRSSEWRRPTWEGQSIYELHIGTFTREGTYQAAIDRLDHLRELGVDAIELMPLADFAGERNWGYDGVALYAPARCYGRPDDLRALVDAAHERGLMVILDVVYNHVGPSGNYLPAYCSEYFLNERATPWGTGFHLDGPGSGPVRDFLIGNAAYWLDEFRFDGLRVDATHAIVDVSERHVLAEIAEVAHERGAFVIAEDERNSPEILRLRDGRGHQFDAAWSDDFHHQVRVALTGTRESYFASYGGTAEELADTLAHGWSYRGREYAQWNGRARGAECDHLPAESFVYCIENHDQVGNRAKGERLEHLISAEQFRAASLLLALSPYPPMFWMGQEWAATTPFLYFTDHEGELGRLVSEGRKREFAETGLNQGVDDVPDPQARSTFENSRLNWAEVEQPMHASMLALYGAALAERRRSLSHGARARDRWRVEAVGEGVALRYSLQDGDALLVVALRETELTEANVANILTPPDAQKWRLVLHTEDARFGGARRGDEALWPLRGPAAMWLKAEK